MTMRENTMTLNGLERAQFVNSIIQSIALVLGGIWAIGYTFFYSDIYKTANKPTQVTATLNLTKNLAVDGFVPLTAQVELVNESERDVHILPGVFLALGSSVEPATISETEYFEEVSDYANLEQDQYMDRYAKLSNIELISGGGIFSGLVISPTGGTSKSYIVYVPEDTFHRVEVVVSFWAHKGDEELWASTSIKDSKSFSNQPCRIKSREPVICEPMEFSEARRDEFLKHDLWKYEAREQIALH